MAYSRIENVDFDSQHPLHKNLDGKQNNLISMNCFQVIVTD